MSYSVILISGLLMVIFVAIAILHVYWAFGGKWGALSVIPTKETKSQVTMPGPIPTLIVALGLFLFAFIVLLQVLPETMASSETLIILKKYGLWSIAVIFLIRALGDFNYVGLFKKIKHTRFAQMDTKLFTPLCLMIGASSIVLELLT